MSGLKHCFVLFCVLLWSVIYSVSPAVAIPNPAAVLCVEMGYEYETHEDAEGNQYGVCIFPDGTSCHAWDFYYGRCGQQWHPCILCGYDFLEPNDANLLFPLPCTDPNSGNPLSWAALKALMGCFPCQTFPPHQATDVTRDLTLHWTPLGVGDYTYDIYLSTEINDINVAETNTPPMTALIAENWDVNSLTLGRLPFGQTCYWRVDMIHHDPDYRIGGSVHSFTVEPEAIAISDITASASSPNMAETLNRTIDGSGLNELDQHSTDRLDMWLANPLEGWIQYDFGQVNQLHEMWIWNYNQGAVFTIFGLKQATILTSEDGSSWIPVPDVPIFSRGSGQNDYLANTVIDLKGLLGQHLRIVPQQSFASDIIGGLSEIRFLHIPNRVRTPVPSDGQIVLDPNDLRLSWRTGRHADYHQVYLGSDPNTLTWVADVNEAEYYPNPMEMYPGQTYYWRIDEVNEAEIPATWQGPTWVFTIE